MGCSSSSPAPVAATVKPAMATKEAEKVVVASNVAAKSAPTASKVETGRKPVTTTTSKLDNASIVFVLGGPGSGKGTQCSKIIDKYPGVKHFSAGDLLRDAVKNGNMELEAIMKEGKLVPVEVTIGLLKDALLASDASVFLIDGFPRALDQADVFEKQIKSCNMVLAFDCPEETMRERLLARGQSSGRADDNEETIVKRFRTFIEQSKPVIDHYKTKGKCVEISSVDTPDDVFTHVQKAISERLPALAASAKTEEQGAAVPVSVAPPASLPTDSKIIFVLGGPGSGKGTQCSKILEKYADCDVHHFSAGDLLRDAVKNGNTELEAIMKEGKLVPMEVTIDLLKDAMIASGGKTFLIDGFPRAWDQAECFESTIQPCSTVLFFDCSEEAMRERLLKRGETSGRADDNEATIVKRFYTFVEQSKPVVDEYKTQGKCHEISAMRTPDEVFVDVKSALDVLLRGAAPPAVPTEAAADAPPAEVTESKGLPDGSKIVFVLGGPGSGKGTQCDKIIKRYEGVKHFSAGDLLRDAVKNGNTELEAIMKEGKLVPMEVTIDLLKDAMIASSGSVFLIDGFPRAWDQAECFEGTIKPCTAVLFFDCSEEVMRARLLKRGETSGRADDNEETIVKRFHTFVEQSKPVVDEYKTQGKCFEVSAEQAPDEVFDGVKKALDSILTVAEE